MGGGGKLNSVFYSDTYHPIQAGSIDGTDILPHDNAVYRALVCYNAGLYDPSGDPKVIGGDPYCTVFVGRLNHLTTEDTLREAMSKYGRVKSLRLVRDIVTGASRGYAFVEYETEREMCRAYRDAHHSFIDDSEIIVDYNRQQLMPGWIPRRLGGGLGGRKESGQLRFGGRDRPFRAPLQAVPVEDLKRLGIPPPPEGRYLSRFQVPSPPRRKQRSMGKEESSHKRSYINKGERSQSRSVLVEGYHNKVDSTHNGQQRFGKRLSVEIEDCHKGSSSERSERTYKRISEERGDRDHKKRSVDGEKLYDKRSAAYNQESSHRRYKYSEGSSHERSSRDVEGVSHKRHRHGSRSDKHKRSVSGDWSSERR